MRVERFEWTTPSSVASAIRERVAQVSPLPDVEPIRQEVLAGRDEAVLSLTNRFDATEKGIESVLVRDSEIQAAVASLDSKLRESLELAIENVREVALAQVADDARTVELPQGHSVSTRTIPVDAVGIYAPGGQAVYPSSVVMCATPAQVANVDGIVLASPPGPDGHIAAPVLAAAALCGIEEIYAMGGAQAIFALAYGTETIEPVDVVVGPGNAWVQEAKRRVYGTVGIDSYAGPSELMVVVGPDTNASATALDLCAQAEHGSGSVLVLASTDEALIDAIGVAAAKIGERPGIDPGALLNTVLVSSVEDAIRLANRLAPEHLELLDDEAAALAPEVTTAGCVLVGRNGATAFGDYVAGSNHVLPTGGAGRFAGPLGPSAFRRRITSVHIPSAAAAKLAPHVKVLAEAEGFPVHGESAMIRVEDDRS
ncbi:MAG TPA: histidinol dehydrogenase [Solirubrobacterales bacterium]|nr:histidinol dehydrogenase [Solirubrobacterales bacterium]